jgi:hypothetical protein
MAFSRGHRASLDGLARIERCSPERGAIGSWSWKKAIEAHKRHNQEGIGAGAPGAAVRVGVIP